jgi:hypothetical protein
VPLPLPLHAAKALLRQNPFDHCPAAKKKILFQV